MLSRLALALITFAGAATTIGTNPKRAVEVQVDSADSAVVVLLRGIEVAPSMGHDGHAGHEESDDFVTFVWPTDGLVQGYRVDLIDDAGNPLPRQMIHHVGVVDLHRRQLPYQKALRLIAVGKETDQLMLPGAMGVRMLSGDSLLVYYKLVNSEDMPVIGAAIRLTMFWTPEGEEPVEVMPLILNVTPESNVRTDFDLPPGLSATSSEFLLPVGGRVRGFGGHLHDYAVEIRLEDVLTSKILVRLKAHKDDSGILRRIDVEKFWFSRGGLRLEKDRPYRVVAVYDNPTDAVIAGGGMAYLAGPFKPDDITLWPQRDQANPIFQADVARLSGQTLEVEGSPAAAPAVHQHN